MERPKEEDYDWNDMLSLMLFAKEMARYADRIESKLKSMESGEGDHSFTEWIGTRKFTKHQVKDRWYDNEYYSHEMIGSTADLYSRFLREKESNQHPKTTEDDDNIL